MLALLSSTSLGNFWGHRRTVCRLAGLVEGQGVRIRKLESQLHECHSSGPTFIP